MVWGGVKWCRGLSQTSGVCHRRRGSVTDVGGLSQTSGVCHRRRQVVWKSWVACGSHGWCVQGLSDPHMEVFYDSFRPF